MIIVNLQHELREFFMIAQLYSFYGCYVYYRLA